MWLWVLAGVALLVGFVAFTGAPYVPSKRRDVGQAFTELYRLGKRDVVVDIGAGDGVVLRAASRLGAARVVGYEIHPLLVLVAKALSLQDSKVEVRLANFWRAKLPADTTVVYVFGDGRDIQKMYTHVQHEATRLGKKLTLISYGFDVPGVVAAKTAGAHHMYTVKPLQ